MIDLDEIAATLASTPGVIRAVVAPFDEDALRSRREPGEWCVLEVVGHLLTCDVGAFRDRIAALIAGSGEVAAFDASAALATRDAMSASVGQLLDEFEVVRAGSVEFVRSLRAEELGSTGAYGSHGTFAAGDFVLEWAYHDHDHVRQILANLQHRCLADMTDTMRSALAD